MKRIKLASASHRDREIILIQFEKNAATLAVLRMNFETLAWSKTFESWYITRSTDFLNRFFKCFKGTYFIDYSAVKKVQRWSGQHATQYAKKGQLVQTNLKPTLAPLNEIQSKAIERKKRSSCTYF